MVALPLSVSYGVLSVPKKRIPKYALHKASGLARVLIDGRHVYLGEHNSPESHRKYAQKIAEHFGTSTFTADEETDSGAARFVDLTIDEMLLKYLHFAKGYYVKNGEPTKELTSMKEAMAHLRGLFADDSALTFGPKKLKAVRDHMIVANDLSRGASCQKTHPTQPEGDFR